MPSRLAGLDLNLLLVLDALLREHSATRAAEALGVTQSAVSRSLSRLRDHLDDPLFVRQPHGLIPTARAQAVAAPLRQALEQLGSIVEPPEAFDPSTSRRRFRLSSADLAGGVIVPRLAARLMVEAPGVDVVVVAPRDSLFDDLQAGELDVSLGVFPTAPAAFRRQALFHDDFACLVRADHPTVGDRLPLATYLELSHVLVAPHGHARGFVDTTLAEQGQVRRIALVVPHFMTAPLVVLETDYVVTLPRRLALRFAALENLRVVEPPVEVVGFTMSQLWHERLQDDPGHAWLRRTLVAAMQPDENTPTATP
ncbi:MAG: LysR family transcriptional regulator [Myxococcota bacterium]